MSIRYKIAFLFAILVTLILVLVSFAVYFFSTQERAYLFDTRLKNRALSSAGVFAGISNKDYTVMRRVDSATISTLYQKSISIISDSGNYVYVFTDMPGDSLLMPANLQQLVKNEHTVFFEYHQKKAAAIYSHTGKEKFIVVIAAIDADGQEYLRGLKKILWLAVVLSSVLCFFAGLIFAKRLIRPVQKITGEVNLITANDLSQRIKTRESNDELDMLAATFNNLLDRLQDSFAIQRRFISDASHELSTPLTSISSQLEVAMQKERTTAEYRELLQSVYEDCRELQQLTHSLLDIAKSGSQEGIELAAFRMDELVLKAVSDVQKQNKLYKTTLEFHEFPENEKSLMVFGNAGLIYIALRNVIENGCKYAADNLAGIAVFFKKDSIEITVTNHGTTITEADIELLFQPFFRADTAKQKPGSGLGLTLAKRIISLHKGTIGVKSGPVKGTVFSIMLPNISSLH